MDEYKKPYLALWNAFSDTIEAADRGELTLVKQILIKAQQDAEIYFIDFSI